jgi:DNA-binding response OmpR family regulator
MAKKILIIDDEIYVTKVLVYRLEAKGYEIVTVTNGKSGVSVIKAQKPDLVLLDYRLPDLTAPETAKKIREEAKQGIPIILITASTDKIETKAKECGAVDYIAKPIEPEELYLKVEKQIGL